MLFLKSSNNIIRSGPSFCSPKTFSTKEQVVSIWARS